MASNQKDTGKSLVIDFGSGYSKVGLSDLEPSCKFVPSLYGKAKDGSRLFGDDVITKRRELEVQSLCDRDNIRDWDMLKEYLNYIYKKELQIESFTKPVLFSFRSIEKKGYKEKIL